MAPTFEGPLKKDRYFFAASLSTAKKGHLQMDFKAGSGSDHISQNDSGSDLISKPDPTKTPRSGFTTLSKLYLNQMFNFHKTKGKKYGITNCYKLQKIKINWSV